MSRRAIVSVVFTVLLGSCGSGPSGPSPRPPQLSATNFLAFGDSITAGVLGSGCPPSGGVSCSIATTNMMRSEQRLHLSGLFLHLEETPAAYPRALRDLLASRYTTQSVAMANEGQGGEFVADGKNRLPAAINSTLPQVLLLQEGANDMNQTRPPIDAIVEDLRAMMREARNRGITVFVGTLLPQRQNACRGYDFCDGVNDVVPTNAKIRTMVADEGGVLVDLYQGFDGQMSTLLGLDGLHPNDAGYQKMAEMFFEAIRQRLEVR